MTTKKKDYLRARLEIAGFDPDVLSSVLFDGGCLGIEEYSEDIWLVYFPEDYDSRTISELNDRLQALNPAFGPGKLAVASLPAMDWNAEWKKHFEPFKIGEKVWVAPPWDQPDVPGDEILLIIDPQMAFGTGSHETTQLMIESLERHRPDGQAVLDCGTGSGILSILAKKMGAGRVIGFDIEHESIENAVHNAELNAVRGVDFRQGDESAVSASGFDVVLANINRIVLQDMLPGLAEKMKTGGRLILSGILDTDEDVMMNVAPPELKLLERRQKKEWLALVFRKEQPEN
ncbi:MAG: 50S ribosomal protein L11 methyltransferase [Calditrichia bacterium]